MRRTEFFQRVPTDRWWEATIAPLVLPGGASPDRHLVLLALRDLTPLRRVEEMRADFVANASHELRTPLASLSGFIETLQGPARNDATARDRFLAIMKEQATRMARLIDDLLSLSRIEQKAHIHPDNTTDLVEIVHEVADGLSPLARERDVEIKIADKASSLVVSGDRDELIRVFENLIENALKYAASGKRVDITLAREPAAGEARDAIVSVRDYGPGIAPEHLPRLTERFYRVDVGESRAQGGTGLGLALVKHILNRHRGRLMIESAPGSGANFSVRLPLSRLEKALYAKLVNDLACHHTVTWLTYNNDVRRLKVAAASLQPKVPNLRSGQLRNPGQESRTQNCAANSGSVPTPERRRAQPSQPSVGPVPALRLPRPN